MTFSAEVSPADRSVFQAIAMGLVLVFGAGPWAAAEEPQLCPICLKANNDEIGYQDKAGNTLARGLLNFGLGWTEMIRQPGKTAREGGNVLTGIAIGAGASVARTFSGLGEILTFWTPKIGKDYIHFSRDCPLDTTQ